MAGIQVQRQVVTFKYKNHVFYADPLYPDKVWTHYDPKGKLVASECYDEDEAIAYIDEQYGELC